MPPRSLEDNVALVTGGAGGLGRATAIALAEAGARIVVADVDVEGGERTAAEADGAFVATDVADLDANHAAVAFAVERYGGLDLVFLNAGVSTGCGVGEDFDLALYRRAMGINLDGVVFGTHAALPALEARGGGSILATASLAGLAAVGMDPVYAANKHAVVGFARSLGLGLADRGVRFNAICPGFAETAIVAPFRDTLVAAGTPIIPPEQVARTALEIFAGDTTGEAWFVQAGRESAPFTFRGIPGPR